MSLHADRTGAKTNSNVAIGLSVGVGGPIILIFSVIICGITIVSCRKLKKKPLLVSIVHVNNIVIIHAYLSARMGRFYKSLYYSGLEGRGLFACSVCNGNEARITHTYNYYYTCTYAMSG